MIFNLQDFSNQFPPYLWNIILISFAIIVGLIIKFITVRLVLRYRKSSEYSLWKSIVIRLGRTLNWFVPLLILGSVMPLFVFGAKLYVVFGKIIYISLVVSFGLLLIRAISVLEDYVYHIFDIEKTDNLRERKIRTQLQFLRKFGITLIVILVFAAILLSFESMRRIGAGLITSVGIGGIIVGIAAQKSLGNLFAGFQIAITQPIRIDDVLIVENEWGRVEEITLTYVVVRIWDLRRLILPITYFIEKPFQNWTRISAEILGTVFIYADYTLPIEPLRAEFSRLLESNSRWDGKVNVMQVTDAKEHTIEVRALMSASNSSNAFDLRCYIREHLVTFIQQNYPESLPKMRATLSAEPTFQQHLSAAAEPKFFPKN